MNNKKQKKRRPKGGKGERRVEKLREREVGVGFEEKDGEWGVIFKEVVNWIERRRRVKRAAAKGVVFLKEKPSREWIIVKEKRNSGGKFEENVDQFKRD